MMTFPQSLFFLATGLLVTLGYSAASYFRRDGYGYNAFRRRFPQRRWVISAYTVLLFIALLAGLLLVPLLWPEADLLSIIGSALIVFGAGQGGLELVTAVTVTLHAPGRSRTRGTGLLEARYLEDSSVRLRGVGRLGIGLLLLVAGQQLLFG